MNRITAVMILGLIFALFATQAMAFTWTVRVPNDGTVPFATIQIMCNSSTGSSGWVYVNRGNTYTWTAPYNEPLTVVEGMDKVGSTQLYSRTCAGTDFMTGYNAVKCSNDVKVKVCPKVSNPSPVINYHYGFCPE